MIADLIPVPGRTPIADEYRTLVARTARVPARRGTFAIGAYDPVSVAKARTHWRKRMVDEYESTTVFSALVAQLVDANASLDASTVVLRMAQDEFRHAEICGEVVIALGGSNRVTRETKPAPIALHPECGPRERALRNVLVTSISEMHSVAFFVASLDRMKDEYLRAVTRELLADEVLHGRFGFYYLEACNDWLDVEVRASIAGYLRHVFAVCEREFVRHDDVPAGADDDALGLVSHALGRDVFHETMEHAVAPALSQFGIDAVTAWRTRSLG